MTRVILSVQIRVCIRAILLCLIVLLAIIYYSVDVPIHTHCTFGPTVSNQSTYATNCSEPQCQSEARLKFVTTLEMVTAQKWMHFQKISQLVYGKGSFTGGTNC